MNRVWLTGPVILFGVPLLGCASFGTHTEVSTPEALPSLKTIALWPIATIPLMDKIGEKHPQLLEYMLQNDPDFKLYAENMSRNSEMSLMNDLRAQDLFRLVSFDSVSRAVAGQDSTYTRWSKRDWRSCKPVVNADAILLTEISFGRESGGVNSYVTLSMFSIHTEQLIVTAKFNTKWGKSYLFPQPAETTLPDAIEGAVNGLAKALRAYPSTSTK